MEILQNLFNQLGDVVSAFHQIALVFSTPLKQVIENYPFLNGLVGVGMFDALFDVYPNITLFGMMFASALSFTIIYSLVKWFLDIIL